ncbi:hypothetical protein BFL38_11850 [Brachyspira hampsonii]|uniref:Uncharacterized protein n=1 Tax=Brachyspira hampsonii TaxID=1287055 RepID=A0A1E5NIY8_9SPIR|nr:hypothetical protein [Brachyspira hampsonii]OEJ16130.1 hypothetical protein BFL38_11850 [Brachyspira hampsonii]
MAKIRDFINRFSGQEEKKAKEEVDKLVMLANLKLDTLENKLKDLFKNKQLDGQIQIIGDHMGNFSREYRVNYKDGNISKAVNDLVEQILFIGDKSAKDIISKCITNTLNAMFTSIAVTEEEKRLFVIMLEGVALVRYDFYVWRSAECDKSIFKHATDIVAITYAKSVIDHIRVSEDELNDAIYKFLGGNVPLADVIKYKKELINY